MSDPLHPEVAIFNAALELPARERAAYLSRACGDDAALRRQVEALLQAYDRAKGFLDTPATGLDLKRPAPTGIPLLEKPGDRVGRYQLLQPIGEGGCGVVYLAEQEEPVRRRVALKVIKLGMDTKQVIARFDAERQALALMDHPNIAKVFDAGATDAGRPYFVMELVRGMKITDFCAVNDVSIHDRLRLFIRVCQAIQHAHQKGVIHRDIKPSNILVSADDGGPAPKVIDFGIAKATQGRLTDQTLFTAFEQFIGTPAYMSPEQASMTSVDIDTRSDIYGLGVLLYELLAGSTPFDTAELLASGLDAMRKTICEKEPMRPSTRLNQAWNAQQTGTQGRSQISQRHTPNFKSRIPEDLDWIVMKCLEKDRTCRYETASALAADVQRHLDHEPVVARPPGNWYRFRKLVRRNKLAFAVGGVLSGALLIVAIGSAIAAWRVAGARQAEQGHRETAETANRQLRSTVRLLELERAEAFFRAHDPAQGVAHLAAILRRDPSNHIAANRLVSALTHRDWALPMAAPMRHAGPVETAWFSPDGSRVLSCSRDGVAQIWDAATGQALAVARHHGPILQARYSPEGTRFITASADGTARIWDANTGVPLTPPLTHTGRVYWAEFSPDGRQVVTASADRTARLWSSDTGALLRELSGHSTHVVMARFSPDGRRLVTGGSHGSIRLWSVETGELNFRVENRTTNLTALSFSPDGKRLVVACADGVARVWNTDNGQPAAKPLVHRQPIEHAVFSPDSHLVLTASEDGTARLWEAETGAPSSLPLIHQGGVLHGSFSPDGQRIVTTSMDNTARLWDVRTGTPLGQPLREHERILHADFSPDGRRLVTASYNWNVLLWDIQPRRAAPLELRAGQRTTSVDFSPDGQFVLAAGDGGLAQQWNVRDGESRGEPIKINRWIHTAEFSPDGRQIVTASQSRSTHVWEAATGKILAGPFRHTNGLWSARFSPDGERIVTTSEDGTARVWNVLDAQPVSPPLRHPSKVKLARFSPDGGRVLTLSKEHARVWDARTGAAVTEPLAHLDHVNWAEFSPDGQRVVTASTDNSACLWDVRTGARAAPLLRHARTVVQAVFSPDGRRVATASIDRTARIWDATTGRALTPALVHDQNAENLRFSPNGRRLVTVGWHGSARIWDVETGRPLTEWLDADRSHSPAFDPAGERIALGGIGAHIWTVKPAPEPVPEWFARFAESIAGIRLDAGGNVELVSRAELDSARASGAAHDSDGYYRRLAVWFLTPPSRRSAWPP